MQKYSQTSNSTWRDLISVGGGKVTDYVEYIKSSGTQYIMTDIAGSSVYRVEIKFMPSSYNAYNSILSAQSGSDDSTVGLYQSVNAFYCRWQTAELFKNRSTSGTSAPTSWDSGLKTNSFGVTGTSTKIHICYNPQLTRAFAGNIYYAKFYDNAGNLLCDLRPAISAEDGHSGEACMYDVVNNICYYNKGTGSFIAGPVVNNN